MSPSIETIAAELSTVRDLLRWAVSQFNAADLFFGHGTDNAWDEALFLVFSAIHLPPDTDQRMLAAKLLSEERVKIVEFVQRRIQERKPAAYLTNQAWFAGLPFYVDERVIIPRSPIAELIEKQFAPWLDAEEVYDVLDLCTGSGCIALACALAFPQAEVVGSDISADALAVAKINVDKHQLQNRVSLVQANVFEGIPLKKYDLIVSNPPYVDAADMRALPPEYRHEPELALAAGEQGLDIVENIIENAVDYLSDNGILVVEVGNSAEALIERFPELPFYWLEFARGGHGVFLLTAEQLRAAFP